MIGEEEEAAVRLRRKHCKQRDRREQRLPTRVERLPLENMTHDEEQGDDGSRGGRAAEDPLQAAGTFVLAGHHR